MGLFFLNRKQISIIEMESTKGNSTIITEHVQNIKNNLHNIPRGKPKSGRNWKSINNQRYSTFATDKILQTSWTDKMKLKNEKKYVKEMENELKEKILQEKEAKKQRRRDNIKKREENEKKSQILQTVTNPAKLKRLKKKQMKKRMVIKPIKK